MRNGTPPQFRKVILVTREGRQLYGDSLRGVIVRHDDAPLLDARLLTDPLALIEWCAGHFVAAGEGNLIVDIPPVYVWDDGDASRQLREFVQAVKLGGWNAGAGVELGSGWITFTAPARPAIHMAVRALMRDDRMLEASLTPNAAVERMCRYANLIGASYRATPGVSAIAALRNRYEGRRVIRRGPFDAGRTVGRPQPRWSWSPRTDERMMSSGDIHWARRPTPQERKLTRQVIGLDMRAAYLAAAAGVRLAWNAPHQTGAIMWDPTLAGFYKIDTNGHWWAQSSAQWVPIVNPIRVAADGSAWVTGPILAYLSEIGEPLPAIIDSYTAPSKEGILREWAEKMRDALPDSCTAGDPVLRSLIKASYAEGFGMMSRAGGRVQRSDWHWATMDECRIRGLRKINRAYASHAIPTLPLKIKVDCVWYPQFDGTTVEDMLCALGSDPDDTPHIGHYRVDKDECGPIDEFLSRHRIKSTETVS